MRDERRWDRGAWVTLAVGIGFAILSIAYALYTYRFPQDGWRYPSNSSTAGYYDAKFNMAGGTSPLQVGDRVVAIEGEPLVKETPPAFPPNLRSGQTVRYTVERSGQLLELDVPLKRLRGDAIIRNTLGSLRDDPREPLVSLVCILVIGFTFFLRPGNLGARYLFVIFSYYFASSWFGFSVSSLYPHTFPFVAQFIAGMMGASWVWVFFASLILLPLAFPLVKAPLRRYPRLLPAVVYGVALFESLVLTYFQVRTGQYSFSYLGFLTFILYAGLAVISIFGTLVHNWLTVREPVVRAQLRWMILGMGLGLGLPFSLMLVTLLRRGTMFGASSSAMLWLFMLLPLCVAVAITRYRLFDIDIIIRRTVVYAVVSALLALVFYGSVLMLQRLFTSLTGQESAVALVASTLVIATLFSPLRRRVQNFVDRRFYRRKYDAQALLARFAGMARSETDLSQLATGLTSTVEEALQPAHLEIRLAPGSRGGRE